MTPNRYQQYFNALNGTFQKLTKLEFLQPDGTVAFSLHNKQARGYNSGHKSAAFIQSGTLSVSMQNGQRRKATIQLANLDGAYDFNVNKIWFGQQIRLSMGLILPDGSPFYLPQMVGEILQPQAVFSPTERTVSFPLVDKWANLDGTLGGRLANSYVVPVNSQLYVALGNLLMLSKYNYANTATSKSEMIDYVTPIFTPYYYNKSYQSQYSDGSTQTSQNVLITPYTLTENAGATLADVALGLNTMVVGLIGYDQTGTLRIEPSQESISDANKPILWHFSPKNSQLSQISETIKNNEVYNKVVVCGEGLTSAIVWGSASNYDATSDTNINIIGEKCHYISNAQYWNSEQCRDTAIYELKRRTVLQKAVTITCSQMFHLMENRLVTIVRTDKQGSPTERHLINSFSIPIAETGAMTINATSVTDIPDFTINTYPEIS